MPSYESRHLDSTSLPDQRVNSLRVKKLTGENRQIRDDQGGVVSYAGYCQPDVILILGNGFHASGR